MKRIVFLIIMISLTGCCSIRKKSIRCQCKEYNKFIGEFWVHDKETGKNYIDTENANFQITSMKDYQKITDCWIGKTPKQIKKMLPQSVTNIILDEEFEIETSKELHDCRYKGTGCKPIHKSAMTIHIHFKTKGKIKRVEVRPKLAHGGGQLDIELYDYTIEDLRKRQGVEKKN